MKTTFEKNGKKQTIYECVTCHKITAKNELKHNSRFGGYGFKKICNRCADAIDNSQDSQQQVRS